MKKYFLLGLALLLLAPSPLRARKLTLVLNNNSIDQETLKENISFEGGTFLKECIYNPYDGFYDEYEPEYQKYASPAFVYEFDDSQVTTRFHATLPLYQIKIFDSKIGEYDDVQWPSSNNLVVNTGDVPISDFISDEFNFDTADLYDTYENVFFLTSIKINSVTASVYGEGLTGQARYNYFLDADIETYSVLEEKQAPFENFSVTKPGLNSFCINGFDWNNSRMGLHVKVNGETIEDIRTIREYHQNWHPVRHEYFYPKGDGVDIRFEEQGTTISAELIDIPETFDVLPYSYKSAEGRTLLLKGVDNSLAGDVNLPSDVTAYYLSGWKVTGLDEYALLNNTKITALTIPASIETIATNALSGMTALTQINVAADNKKFISTDGVLFTTGGYTLRQFPIAKATQYEVPDGTKAIGRDAFYKSNLTSITLPSSIIQIGYDAFGYCTKLKEINIPAKATAIGEYAFDHCTSLTTVTLPKLTELPKFMFNYCSALTTIDFPSTLTIIGEGAFTRCSKLKSVALPSITELAKNAFNNCTSLTNIVLPASLQTIGEKAFNNCTALNAITCWMEDPIALPDNAFPEVVYNNASLKVPVASVEKYKAANGWKKFKNIVGVIDFADAKVKAICVENWDSDGDAEIDLAEAAAVTSLGALFRENKNIKTFDELRYFTGLTKIDDNAFRSCTLLQSVVVPANVTEIGKYAFYACYALTDLSLPEGLKTIGDYGIGACTNLKEIVLPSTLTTIKTRAFYYDKKLASISIPAAVTSIGASAFSSCSVLLDVTANMLKPCAIASNVFSANTFDNATLTVPYGAYDIYKTTNYWSKFANINTQAGMMTISANSISIIAGESGDMVLNLQENLPFVSFQFDLTLPAGITLENAAMIPSSDFVVSTANVDTNKWRVLAYSPNNKPINANVGDLVALTLQTEILLPAGMRPVSFTNISVTTLGSNNFVSSTPMEDFSTTVTVVDAVETDAGKGDVNLDGTVNVQDIVVLINHIFGNTPKKFSLANADANADGIINVADVSAIVLLCMPNSSASAAPAHAPAANMTSLTWDTTNGLALSIDEATSYVAAQMDVTVNGTLLVNDITSTEGHTPVWQQIGENRYRVLVFSNANDTFSAFGPHLFFDVQGDGEISLCNALLVDADGDAVYASASSTGVTTGITTVTTELSAPADVYSISGQLIRRQATSLRGLPSGIYMVNGRKMAVK